MGAICTGILSGCQTQNSQQQKTNEQQQTINEQIYNIPEIKIISQKPNREPNYLSQKEFNKLVDEIYNPQKADPLITKDVFKSFIKKESSLDINAFNESTKARGLGQLLEETWSDIDTSCYYTNVYNPQKNLEVSLKYLNWIPKGLEKLHPNWENLSKNEKLDMVIASYNWGIGKLKEKNWDFSKAPSETKKYRTFVYNELGISEQ